jgi:hypothetical protein
MTNIYNLFKFIEDKEGKAIPLRIQLEQAPESIKPEHLKIDGHVNLNNLKIRTLPEGLEVGGTLSLVGVPLTTVPSTLKVYGNLNLTKTEITSLPSSLKVGGRLNLLDTPVAKKYTKEQLVKMLPNVAEII